MIPAIIGQIYAKIDLEMKRKAIAQVKTFHGVRVLPGINTAESLNGSSHSEVLPFNACKGEKALGGK